MLDTPRGLVVQPKYGLLAIPASYAFLICTSFSSLFGQVASIPSNSLEIPSSRRSVMSHRAGMYMQIPVVSYSCRHGHRSLASLRFSSVLLAGCSPVTGRLFVLACFDSSARCRSFRLKISHLPPPPSPLHLISTATIEPDTAQSVRLYLPSTLLCI